MQDNNPTTPQEREKLFEEYYKILGRHGVANSIFFDLARNLNQAWQNYYHAMYRYMQKAGETTVDIRATEITLYNMWVEASELYKLYAQSIRDFTDKLSWNNTIPVGYGDIVGVSIPGTGMIYFNAFTGPDPETALCRRGDQGQLYMRIGGLPVGTHLYLPNGKCYSITEYQVAVLFSTNDAA